MKKITLLWVSAIFCLLATPGLADDDDLKLILRVDPANLRAVLETYRLELEDSASQQGLFLVEVDDDVVDDDADDDDDDDKESLNQFINRVRLDPRVLGFELDQEVQSPEVTPRPTITPSLLPAQQALQDRSLVHFFGVQALKGFVAQPAASIVGLGAARNMATGRGIVAVIDTGVDPDHPLLRGALVPGYDFTRNQTSVNELDDLGSNGVGTLSQEAAVFLESLRPAQISTFATPILTQEAAVFLEGNRPPSNFGHGTMVAGLIRLVAPTAQIMPLKAFTATGTASLFNLIKAIYHATDKGARVINMSFTIAQPSDEFTRAINQAALKGVICVAAAGNEGRETIVFPAAYSNVIGVASTTNADTRSSFSNFGTALVSLAAPGEGLITAYPGGYYAAVWGTSFSAPLVSGTVALIEQVRPGATFADALEALEKAVPVENGLGSGRLDIPAVLYHRLTQQ